VEKGRRVRSVLVLVNESAQKSTAARKRERTGVVLLRQGSKRPGDRPVIRIVGHPENFERILAPHGRDCGVTRDLGSAFRGAVFGTSDKNAFFFRFAASAKARRERSWFTSIPNPRASHQ
jgi:hypothetical protein